MRERKLKIEKQVLEQKVLERTLELREKNETLAFQAKELTDKNLKITQSINYAQRIQSAILPPDEYIKKHLPDSFVLFKPKDIVSGDFYWFNVVERDDKPLFLIAAADCTGHGVPGAMMSLVGFNLLNDAAVKSEQRRPSDILNNLNSGLHHIFENSSKSSQIKDGMDIALISIDPENMCIEFSGAHQPVYVVRNGKLITIDATPIPIGNLDDYKIKEFSNHRLQLEKSDVIYLFSDGYADQFGGPKNRKFMRQPFQDLLVLISTLPMPEQRQMLDDSLSKWIGNRKQIDDILVMGVRV